MKAMMIPGTKKMSDEGYYIVAVECSGCGTRQWVGFAGWCGLLCRPSVGGCGADLERVPYRLKR